MKTTRQESKFTLNGEEIHGVILDVEIYSNSSILRLAEYQTEDGYKYCLLNANKQAVEMSSLSKRASEVFDGYLAMAEMLATPLLKN